MKDISAERGSERRVVGSVQKTVSASHIDKTSRRLATRIRVQMSPDNDEPCNDSNVLENVLHRVRHLLPIAKHEAEGQTRIVNGGQVSSERSMRASSTRRELRVDISIGLTCT